MLQALIDYVFPPSGTTPSVYIIANMQSAFGHTGSNDTMTGRRKSDKRIKQTVFLRNAAIVEVICRAGPYKFHRQPPGTSRGICQFFQGTPLPRPVGYGVLIPTPDTARPPEWRHSLTYKK
ncbi:hypothetical protein LshimejAT787_1301180 [Lyophyllum shimeji]|uniref:Uncharacterized protein n=1 Tax=Lyophyllum shimeji TaxID=47721 RepID=A0A9P3PXT5_LYOSH|nr:hypothetical protein LshimejAT787_1301180 [Lyophyllum shimeji]